jgi:hypothetical protein
MPMKQSKDRKNGLARASNIRIADWATDLHVVISPVRWQPSDGKAMHP